MQTFMNKLASKFIKPDVIRQLKDDKLSFSKLDTSLANQKDGVDLTIGNITKPQLRRAVNEGDISQNHIHKFCGCLWMICSTNAAGSSSFQIGPKFLLMS